jgi:hypothetical protein
MTVTCTINGVPFGYWAPIQASAPTRQVTYEEIDGTDGLLSVVRNVEVCAVGIEYPLASGPTTFTPEDLLHAVASQDDPAIQSPRVWLGHPDDQRFHQGRTTIVGSAEPALGTVINMRTEDEGMTLVGDVAGCPTWLAKILASAYPNRSIEGYRDAVTATGSKWNVVVTDLALLGVKWPGVSTLKDLQSLYSENGPTGVEVEEGLPVAAARSNLQAQAELEKIRRDFIAALSDLKIPGYPWVRAILQDPNELIIDDDEGGLYRLPYDGSKDPTTFGELRQVKIQYVNASQKRDPQARALLANMLTAQHSGRIAASWETRAASRPVESNQEGSMNPELIRLLRERTGLTAEQLPDDSTEEQIQAALQAQTNPPPTPSAPAIQPTTAPRTEPGVAPRVGDPGGGDPSPDQVPSGPGPGNMETDPARQPVAASVPEGYIAVPAEAWQTVQANAAAGARIASQTEGQRRDGICASAVREGRISPAQRQNFRSMFDRDPQGTETLLTASVDKGGLMPGTIPVEARGVDPAPGVESEAYPPGWLPELTSASPSTVTVES